MGRKATAYLTANLHRLRRATTIAVVVATIASLIAVVAGDLKPYSVADHEPSEAIAILSALLQTTATVIAILIAALFITAQIGGSVRRPASTTALYRSFELWALVAVVVATLSTGYVAILRVDTLMTDADQALINSCIVLAVACLILIVPTIVLQVENLDPVLVMAKLASRLTPESVKDYGLTSVEEVRGEPARLSYSLYLYGLEPRSVDPFRPLHEVIMEAVEARDRVLLGKLYLHLLSPIPRAYGAYWDPTGVVGQAGGHGGTEAPRWARWRSSRIDAPLKLHLTLGLMHYLLKRGRNLRTEWDGRDTGRHGLITGTGKVIRALAPIPDSGQAITICTFCVLHLSRSYADIDPYGRIEPLNMYFDVATYLVAQGKQAEAELCVASLGWIRSSTSQLSPDRSPELQNRLSKALQEVFADASDRAKQDRAWLPGNGSDDPWRDPRNLN